MVATPLVDPSISIAIATNADVHFGSGVKQVARKDRITEAEGLLQEQDGSRRPLLAERMEAARLSLAWSRVNLAIPIGSIVVPFWGYLIRILNRNQEKELLWSLWVVP